MKMQEKPKKPKYEMEIYRKFIREATPYVSVIVGRKLKPTEGDTMSDEEIYQLALLIDARVTDLKNRRH